MNERIKNSFENAGGYYADFEDDGNFQYVSPDLEKFVELIVQECYQWAKENGGIPSDEDHRALKEHFGIK